MIKFILRVFIALFSSGWLLPTWMSFHAYLYIWQSEGWPVLLGMEPAKDYPFHQYSEETLMIACIWLALVIIFWSWKFSASSKQ